MSGPNQRPNAIRLAIQSGMTDVYKKELRDIATLPSDNTLSCAPVLCDILLQYCSYRIAEATPPVNPFDDPFVGAALITSDGELLGTHRKEGRNEPHAEVETLLQSIDAVNSRESNDLAAEIRGGLNKKIWLQGEHAERGFIKQFERAGHLVREHNRNGLVLLSTLEPCRDFESQPSCSRLISAFRPDAVIYACDDTNGKGQGRPILLEHRIRVFPNASYRLNVEINLLFYAAVHYLTRLHASALEGASRFEVSYVIANLSRLAPELTIGSDGRLQIQFDHQNRLPVHRAPIEPRAPREGLPTVGLTDQDRVLFINSFNSGFLTHYFHRHVSMTERLPGILICPQSASDTSGAYPHERASNLETERQLKARGVHVHCNVLRKSDETFLALHSIFRLDQGVSGARNLYVFVKEEGDKYSHCSGPVNEVADHLSKVIEPRRVTVYFGCDEVRGVKGLITSLNSGKLFEPDGNLALASFQLVFVVRRDGEALRAASELKKWLKDKNLSHRFAVDQKTQRLIVPRRAEMLHELISGRLDPIAHEYSWPEGILDGVSWKDRQVAGLFLSGAAKQDPMLYRELIATKVPAFAIEDWRRVVSLLNAIAKHRRPIHYADWKSVDDKLLELADGIEASLEAAPSPELVDVVWRFIAACLSIADSCDEVKRYFAGLRMRQYIGTTPFLLKEMFFYISRYHGDKLETLQVAFEIWEDYGLHLSENEITKVALRVARLSVRWRSTEGQASTQRLSSILARFPSIKDACDLELQRCHAVISEKLAGVFAHATQDPMLFATYLFMQTAEDGGAVEGLFSAVGREIEQAIARPTSGKVPMSWRGDKTSLARLALSEVSIEVSVKLLVAMAQDEDDTIKWAALILATDHNLRRKMIGESLTKTACITARFQVAAILNAALSGNSHYWLKREFLSVLRAEHRAEVNAATESSVPRVARIQVGDVAIMRDLLRSDGLGEHLEVVEELGKVRKHMKRVLLVLPPIDADESMPMSHGQTMTPPLELGSIAGYLLSCGHDVELIDCRRFPEQAAQLSVRARKFDFIGFSVGTTSFRATQSLVTEISASLRDRAPKIILSGHAVTLHPREFLETTRFAWDYLVLGDGEIPFLRILQSDDNSKSIECDGVIRRGAEASTGPVPDAFGIVAQDWDDMPWSGHELFLDPQAKSCEPATSRNGRNRVSHIEMSRGCAWKCSFCTEAILRGVAGEVRRSASDVLEEIRWLVTRHGVGRIHFVDDNLLPQVAVPGVSADKAVEWTNSLLKGLSELTKDSSDFGWRGIMRFEDFLRYERLIEGWLERLRDSGCMLLAFGVETGLEEKRKRLKGGFVTNDEIHRVIEALRAHKIDTEGHFIIGGDGEDDDSVSATIEMSVNAGFTLAYFALYKNFRDLIRMSRDQEGTASERKRTFMRFSTFVTDFDDWCSKLDDPSACSELFGIALDQEKTLSAKQSLQQLSAIGFSFRDLFKYDEFHDNIGDSNSQLKVWRNDDGVDVSPKFFRAVRRAYFEFYARDAFVKEYARLVDQGY